MLLYCSHRWSPPPFLFCKEPPLPHWASGAFGPYYSKVPNCHGHLYLMSWLCPATTTTKVKGVLVKHMTWFVGVVPRGETQGGLCQWAKVRQSTGSGHICVAISRCS